MACTPGTRSTITAHNVKDMPPLNNYMLGATVPFGKFSAKGSYIYSDGNTAAGGDAQQLALGLDYNLSKRTNFYSAYSWIDNSGQPYERRGRCDRLRCLRGAGTAAEQLTGANGGYLRWCLATRLPGWPASHVLIQRKPDLQKGASAPFFIFRRIIGEALFGRYPHAKRASLMDALFALHATNFKPVGSGCHGG